MKIIARLSILLSMWITILPSTVYAQRSGKYSPEKLSQLNETQLKKALTHATYHKRTNGVIAILGATAMVGGFVFNEISNQKPVYPTSDQMIMIATGGIFTLLIGGGGYISWASRKADIEIALAKRTFTLTLSPSFHLGSDPPALMPGFMIGFSQQHNTSGTK